MHRIIISAASKFILTISYPNCSIHRSVFLERGVIIKPTDGGSIEIGEGCHISQGTRIVAKGAQISIGANSFIGPNCIIVASDGIVIGRDALIAEFVTIRDQDHGTALNTEPFRSQPKSSDKIDIRENVWLGAKSTILKGISIGPDSVVAAHSVVNRNIRSGTLAGGVPAKEIKPLNSADEE